MKALIYSIIWIFVRIGYRIKILGSENIPKNKGALLISNHISYLDGILIYFASPRKVRFVLLKSIYNRKLLKPIFKMFSIIPISRKGGKNALQKTFAKIRNALNNGELVCIFAEGVLTRTGNINKFHRGFERIMKDMDVPIIPVHLDNLWGSAFSFYKGRFFFKIPKQIPYHVTISFGRRCKPDIKAFELRSKILKLGEQAFKLRIKEDESISKLFFKQAKRHPLRFCAVDYTEKKLNFAQVFASSYILMKRLDQKIKLKTNKPENIGVLLPPSHGAVIANVALALKARISVNLNYTLTNKVLKKILKVGDIKYILSSREFLKKRGIHITGAKIIYLEDVLKNISLTEKIVAISKLFTPLKLADKFVFNNSFKHGKNDLATIIFTSGSTGNPKGVMLSHENILSNIEGVSDIFCLKRDDRLLGILPFFHSFGFTTTLWLPLLKGFAGIYCINPLEAKKVGEFAKKFKATLMMSTPTFLTAYVKKCEAEDFKSIRILLVGAEKLKQEVSDAFEEKFGIKPMEGYGATELAPVVSVNLPDYVSAKGARQKAYKMGKIGKPIPGLAVKIIDPDSGNKLGEGKNGLILIKGGNVMIGYYKDKKATNEVLKDGWYNTGDIGHLDADGFLEITDRLSRFSKIAGEMIPHIKIENAINSIIGAKEIECVIVSVPDEKRGERLIAIHTKDFDVDDVIAKMRHKGLPNLWIPNKRDFFKVEKFPILGMGKLDLRGLKKLAEKLTARSKNV